MRRRRKMNRRDKWLVYTTAPSQNLFRFDLTSDVTPDIIITPQQQSLIDTGPTHCDARRTSIRPVSMCIPPPIGCHQGCMINNVLFAVGECSTL